MDDIRALISDDAYACSFQSLGQYRAALLQAVDRAAQPELEALGELGDEELWAIWNEHDGPIPMILRAAIAADRARAALAEPEPEGPTTGGKKPLSLVCYCYMKGMPPNPHQDWQAYFDHCAATGTISGLKLEAIQPTPSVNDSIPHSIPQQTAQEGPTLDDIWELCEEHEFTLDVDGTSEEENCNVLWAIAHAVLTRWGRPAPEPPADGEVAELVAKLRRLAPQNPLGTADPIITRAADLLEHLSGQPS